jgi:4-hydroxyphenylpyruvate dioxygenase-like putative hemolysin
MSETLLHDVLTRTPAPGDPLPPRVVDHIRFHVGNARQAAHYYATAFGMCPVAYRGPETGQPQVREYVLVSGAARFVIAGEVSGGTLIGADVAEHGDAVADVALAVADVDAAVAGAVARGADLVVAPFDVSDEHGTVRLATITAPDGSRHTLVDRATYGGPFLPGYAGGPHVCRAKPVHHPQLYADAVDHWSGPAGPGVRHIALATTDIVRTVLAMTEMGVDFEPAPDDHYAGLAAEVGETRVPPETMRDLRIRAGRDGDGYLLRAFTAPVQDRPPLVYELVERHPTTASADELT